jgi:hypothetical protein
MSDYLSTLAARSLRRETACEPRRAQMFEPRPETPDAAFVEEVHEGLPAAETPASVTPERQVPITPPRAASDEPNSYASPRHTAGPVETVREAPPPKAARLVETQTASRESISPPIDAAATEVASERPTPRAPRDFAVVPRTPPAHDSSPLHEPERLAAPASDSVEAPTRARRADVFAEVFDEGDRERTSAIAPRAAVEPRAERIKTKSPTTVVDTEVVPQPRASKPSQPSETLTGAEAESLAVEVSQPLKATASAEVRPVSARPSAPNARAALSAPGDFTVPVAAREGRAQTQQQPTIEVTIGRIEVRAVTPPAPQPQPRQRQAPPKMSLDDYLRAQGGGRS